MFSFIIVFLCTSSCVVRVVVHRLIVHDELVADEVEGVGAVAVGAVFELGNLLTARPQGWVCGELFISESRDQR